MNNQALLNALADIEGPTPPDWQPFMTGTLIAVILMTVLIGLLWKKQQKKACPASDNKHLDLHTISPAIIIQRLDQLHSRWEKGIIDDREASYQLAALIRHGLRLNQYTQATNSTIDVNQWQPTLQTLTALRYQPQSTTTLDQATFTTIKNWLTQSARQTTVIDHA